jgi:hypothetical protein
VTWVRHVRVDLGKLACAACLLGIDAYTTVGAVCAPPLLGGLVDLNVLHNQVAGVKTLGVGVGLGVLEEAEKKFGGLDGPAGLGHTESFACIVLLSVNYHLPMLVIAFLMPPRSRAPSLAPPGQDVRFGYVLPLTLCGAASAAGIPPHGNSLLLFQDIAQKGKGTLKLPSVDGLGRLAGVLERGTKVAAASPGGLCVVDARCCVADLGSISRCIGCIIACRRRTIV